MAVTNIIDKIAVARVADCEIKVFVSGTATTLVDIAEVSDVSASINMNSAEARGDGATFAVSSMMDKATIEFGSMCLSADLLSALIGSTAATNAGVTETSNYKVSDLAPYFQFEIQSKDITGLETVDATNGLPGDVHIRFPKCKLTAISDILPPVDGFAMIKATAVAIPGSDNILFSIIKNTTATAIS